MGFLGLSMGVNIGTYGYQNPQRNGTLLQQLNYSGIRASDQEADDISRAQEDDQNSNDQDDDEHDEEISGLL